MTLQEFLDLLAEVHVDSMQSPTELEVIIASDSNKEYVIDMIYPVKSGIAIDIKPRREL